MFINPQAIMTLFIAFIIGLVSAITRADLSPADKMFVEKAIEERQVTPEKLDEAITKLKEVDKLSKEKPDEQVLTQLTRALYFKADVHPNKDERIPMYQEAIDVGKRVLELNPENAAASFWYAAAIGKQGLDMGITRALKNARPMREKLETTLKKDEKYEHAGAHRAMGRMYIKLPGWPISFGNKEKGLEHTKKAVELAPTFPWNHLYHAEALLKNDKKDEAQAALSKFDSLPKNPKLPRENEEMEKFKNKLKKNL